MLYDIRLQIDHHYPAASDHVRNLLRLMPQDGPDQRVLRRSLRIDPPPDERHDGSDFFGNATVLVAWHRPVERIALSLSARAERRPPAAAASPPLAGLDAEIAAEGGLGPASPLHFRGPSPRIAASEPIAAFARATLAQTARAAGVEAARLPVHAAVAALGRAVHDRIAFDPGATDAATPPETAFAAGRGVCQDMAQIMIAGLRALGIPAAYVSGFLRTRPPPGQPRLEGVDAMHGWVAAWAGAQAGWIDHDPTNARWAGEDYIVVARGRDYADAAPVRGALRTAGGQSSGHAVDVIALDAPAHRH